MIEERPEWRTPTVVSLCKAMRENGDYQGTLPILADALEEAGYPLTAMLNVCRDGKSMDKVNAQRFICEVLGGEFAAAVKWLDEYANRLNAYDPPEGRYRTLMEDLANDRMSAHGSQSLYGRFDIDDEESLRENAEIVMGVPVNFEDLSYSCGC